jgi:carbamoyltransferase
LFAAHAERYTRRKNDPLLNEPLLTSALRFGEPDVIAWYERPWLKKTRHLFAGQWSDAFTTSDLPKKYLREFRLDRYPIEYVNHHDSHAAAGFLTSPFDSAAVLVIDAIGEWGTVSIGEYGPGGLRWLTHSRYPHSLGLLYSAFTARVGLKPNEEEYILMGMAAYGRPLHVDRIREEFIESIDLRDGFRLRRNVHLGIDGFMPEAKNEDLAASIQLLTEEVLLEFVRWITVNSQERNLILMGGVALNCVANEKIARFWSRYSGSNDRIWIMPNPGDAGSSLGAAAFVYGKHVKWRHPYLGTDIAGTLDVERTADALACGEIIGVAAGKAEFGPRALGNRSLCSDPRGPSTKDRVNEIKKRDKFRPFAPLILEEHAETYFDMPVAKSPYMQFTAPCKDGENLPAICHVDGSSRVQTLSQDENPVMHAILTRFMEKTGCPMILNTSLNVKGEPLVDTLDDALRFGRLNGVAIYAPRP